MEIKRIFHASVLPIGISVLLVLISIVIQLLAIIMKGSIVDVLRLADAAYSYLLIPIFLVLYLWVGIRAVRTYRLDPLSAGSAAAFSSVVIGLVHLAIVVVITLLVLSNAIPISGFSSTEAVLAATFFGDVSGTTGVLLSAVCGMGFILMQALIAFVVGAVGGFVAQKR